MDMGASIVMDGDFINTSKIRSRNLKEPTEPTLNV
jgi:hypothetical protein